VEAVPKRLRTFSWSAASVVALASSCTVDVEEGSFVGSAVATIGSGAAGDEDSGGAESSSSDAAESSSSDAAPDETADSPMSTEASTTDEPIPPGDSSGPHGNDETDSGAAVCGDGVRNGAEDCDGTDLGGSTCEGEGFVGGELACEDCTLDASDCTDVCVEEGEPCDDIGDCCNTGCGKGGSTCLMNGQSVCCT